MPIGRTLGNGIKRVNQISKRGETEEIAKIVGNSCDKFTILTAAASSEIFKLPLFIKSHEFRA